MPLWLFVYGRHSAHSVRLRYLAVISRKAATVAVNGALQVKHSTCRVNRRVSSVMLMMRSFLSQ